MKPFKVIMTDDLIKSYGLKNKMEAFDRDFVHERMFQVNEEMLKNFHSD